MRVRELVVKYQPCKGGSQFDGGSRLDSPKSSEAVIRPLLESEAVEVFGILCLTTKHRPICWHVASRGALDATVIHPRDIFKVAFLANAAALIVAHNHPSGDPEPSRDDLSLTRRLITAGDLLGVDVLDHIIIGFDGRYSSLREMGRI